MSRATVARVDLDALCHNLRTIRVIVGDRAICPAVKADAYGHGAPVVAHVLKRAGADMLGVAMTEEAVDLRAAGVPGPILLLAGTPVEDIEELLDHSVTACITGESFAAELGRRAAARGTAADAHVCVDTGMRRQGLDWETAAASIAAMSSLPGLRVTGVFSHLACSGDEDMSFNREQVRRFRHVLDELDRAGLRPLMAHLANSNGVLRLPEAHFDAVRPGLIVYGMCSPAGMHALAHLRPVMSLRTRIVQCRRIAAGEKIGYGHTHTLRRDSVIATLPIGYHDGYDRGLGNVGQVLVRGRRAPIVGRVCMDQTMIDVTDVPGVQVGDEVVLYGAQGEECIPIEEAAAKAGRIPYELTCAMGRRVRREYVLDGVVVPSTPPRSVVPPDTLSHILSMGAASGDESCRKAVPGRTP